MSIRRCLWVLVALFLTRPVVADEPEAQHLASQAVAAAGGDEKLLKLLRIRERLNVSSDPEKHGNERVTVVEPPKFWWQGKRERVREEREPAIFLVWAWTLGAITDPASKLERIPDVTEGDRPAAGLRIRETIKPPMDCYFDQETHRLVRIDWRSDIHRFSDFREHDGATYAAKCVGFKKSTGKQWYNTEILELERLAELPEGLAREP
jgi:hypothetical protein